MGKLSGNAVMKFTVSGIVCLPEGWDSPSASDIHYFSYLSLEKIIDFITIFLAFALIFSSPGRSPGRAIVLPPAAASALAKC